MTGTGEGAVWQALDGLSVRDVIDRRAAEAPDRMFLVAPDDGAVLTYGALRGAVRAVAADLAGQRLEPGDRVAYALGNGAQSVLAILGCLYGGYLATAVNLVSGAETIGYVLEHSGARLVLVQPHTADLIVEAAAGRADMPPLRHMPDVGDLPMPTETPAAPTAQSDGLLMYTSGTTGRPKGVLLTHRNLLAGGANTAMAHRLGAEDRALCVLPLYHINGFCVSLMGVLASGGTLVMPHRFSVSTFWTLLKDQGCTWFSVVPTQISYLLHDPRDPPAGLEGLRFGRSASAPLPPDVHAAFEQRFHVPIVETMGLTETAAQILSNPLPPGDRRIGSPGVAVGNEVIVADADLRPCPPGTEGELLVRGPNVMRGYRNNPEATAATLSEGGWLRTGDLGRMDADSYVYVTGRLKELIIKGGENIAPREVDDALYSHPDVVEAAAFARDCPDYGQRVEAGVVVAAGSAVTEAELIGLCSGKIGAFRAPDRIHFFEDLPKGPSGKVQRLKLARLAADLGAMRTA